MESANAVKPKISVLIPAVRGYRSVLAALDAWEAQTRRDALEILILAPDRRGTEALPPGQRVVETGDRLLNQMRAAGIREAAADHVMIAEDHCLPDPDWTEIMLPRIEEGWDALGGALSSGDPSSVNVQAPFLLGYGQWILPESGPTHILPGHNTIWRKDLLLDLQGEVEIELLVMTFMVQRMHREGKRLFVDHRAMMRHFDPVGVVREFGVLASGGLGFGAVRTRHWNPLWKLLYLGAAPLIGAMHWRRAFLQHLRTRGGSRIDDLCLLWAIPQALAWGCGESLGAVLGIQRVVGQAWRAEIKPVSRERVAAVRKAAALVSERVDDVVGAQSKS